MAQESNGSRIALRVGERGELGHRMQFEGWRSAVRVMLFCFYPPRDACLQQGGEGGVNITAQRVERSVMLAPSPLGTDTARPADLLRQLQSR
jgi:hypothetical protein